MTFLTQNDKDHKITLTPTYLSFPFNGPRGNSKIPEWYTKTISITKLEIVQYDFDEDEIRLVSADAYTIKFGSKERAKEFFDLLKTSFDKCEVEEKQLSPFQASWGIFLTSLIIVGLTILGYFIAVAIDNGEVSYRGGRMLKTIAYFIPRLLGPIGMIIVGGLISALIVMLGINRWKKPPIRGSISTENSSRLNLDE